MGSQLTKLIEAWFDEHDEDGEFVRLERAAPYSVIAPLTNAGRMILTTKPGIVSAAIEHCTVPVGFGMVGRHGLPAEADASWLAETFGPRGFLFLGDVDPVDLMVFSWLRDYLPPGHVKYLGLNDALLEVLECPSLESICIPCTSSERSALALLNNAFPDLSETIGDYCTGILHQGRKIELEAMLSGKKAVAPILQSAVVSAG